ncbi:MAG: hypothetical protein H0U92_02645 [Actinobacteria bacterium]|nr:hypothetical protein [Actinomycetota bacterium]
MTALQHALDLPDEPRRARRGLLIAAIAAVAWMVLGVVVARMLAIGGWKSPLLPLGSLLAIPALTIAWVLAGNHRHRMAITVAAMAVSLVAIPFASAGATPSTGHLASIADDIGLPGKTQREIRIGDGRCRPACSELRRTSVIDGISFVKAVAQARIILLSRGYAVREYGHRVGAPTRIDASRRKVLVSLELQSITPTRTRIAAIFLAQGPTPDTSVG